MIKYICDLCSSECVGVYKKIRGNNKLDQHLCKECLDKILHELPSAMKGVRVKRQYKKRRKLHSSLFDTEPKRGKASGLPRNVFNVRNPNMKRIHLTIKGKKYHKLIPNGTYEEMQGAVLEFKREQGIN